jgi:hypothetical protein
MRRITPKFPGALVVGALLVLISLPLFARDRDTYSGNVPTPPPEPNPLVVEVPRGGPVWITLSAYSLTSQIIRYRIWRKPKAGQLGIPQMVTADTAVVKYKPPAGAGPGEDDFAYEVQSVAGVSAPAVVQINITDKDPVLIAPDELDFGEVLPGETARRVLVLQNIGGGLAQGTVQVPEGWAVEGDAAYRMAPGVKQSFTIDFQPKEERDYTGDVEYTGDLQRATDLVGREVPPIAVTSGAIELPQAGNMRVGTIQVVNRSAQPLTLRVATDPDLEADATVNVPAKGAANLVVQTRPAAVGEIYGEVTVQGAGEKLIVPVHAPAMQAIAHSTPASLPAQTPAQTPAQAASRPAPAPAAPEAYAALPAVNLPAQTQDSAMPERGTPVLPLEVRSVGETEARLTCDFKGLAPVRSYRPEAQTVVLDAHGRPEAKWVPLAGAQLDFNQTAVSVNLDHLQPGALYVVRLVGVDEHGSVTAMSSSAQVWTARAPKGGHWGWAALAVAALSGLAVWWRRKRAGAF